MTQLKNILIIIALCFGASDVFAQLNTWRSQNPQTLAGTMTGIQFVSARTAYIVGDHATFGKTLDSGNTWIIKTGIGKNTSSYFTGVSFIDPLHGMISAKDEALRTSDGGKTWEEMNVVAPTLRFYDIAMYNDSIAFIVGAISTISKTTDFGKTWKPFEFELAVGNFRSIRVVSSDFIVITSDNGYFLYSVDTGATWIKKPLPAANNIYSIAFENSDSAFAVGELGYIARTNNRGETWKNRSLTDSVSGVGTTINSIDSKAPGYFVAAGEYGALIATTDDGNSWTKAKLGFTVGIGLKCVRMWDQNYGLAVGDQGIILRTTDAGMSWRFLPTDPMYSNFYGIAFPKGDTLHGIAIGFWGSVATTSDGGKHWKGIQLPTINNLRAVTFSDSVTAWAVGDYGYMTKTTDRGLHWTPQTSGTQHHLYAVCFPSKNIGWVVGAASTALKTNTGGLKWFRVEPNFPYSTRKQDTLDWDYTTVSFCDEMNGCITPGGTTTDGGLTWKSGSADLMISPTHLCWVGINQLTYDGSISTAIGDSTFSVLTHFGAMFAVDFFDSLHGVAVGYGGKIYHTTDAGRNWVQKESGTSQSLFWVSYPSLNVTSVAGLRGTILRYTSDEKPPLGGVSQRSESALSNGFEILSLFPNPAQTHTTMMLGLTKPMPIQIRVFDERGAELQSLEMGVLSSGEHSVPLWLTGLASGTYIVEVSSQNETHLRKLRLEH